MGSSKESVLSNMSSLGTYYNLVSRNVNLKFSPSACREECPRELEHIRILSGYCPRSQVSNSVLASRSSHAKQAPR
jgi:hypothetical protein